MNRGLLLTEGRGSASIGVSERVQSSSPSTSIVTLARTGGTVSADADA